MCFPCPVLFRAEARKPSDLKRTLNWSSGLALFPLLKQDEEVMASEATR